MALTVFGNAAQRTDEDKGALLKAMAEAGTAGKQALQASAGEINTAQQRAVDEAVRRFGDPGFSRPIPAGASGALLTQARQPGDAYAADNAQAQRLFAQDTARSNAANAAYFDKVKSAIPLVSARAEEAARQRAMERELAQMEADVRRQELDVRKQQLEQEKNGGADPFEALKKRYGVEGLNALLDEAGTISNSGRQQDLTGILAGSSGSSPAAFRAADERSMVAAESPEERRMRGAIDMGLSGSDVVALNALRKEPTPEKPASNKTQFTERLVNYSTRHPDGQAPAILSQILDGQPKSVDESGNDIPAVPAARSAADALSRLNAAISGGSFPKGMDPEWFREMIRLRFS